MKRPSNLIESLIAGAELMAEDLDAAPEMHEPKRTEIERLKTFLRTVAKNTNQDRWEVGLAELINAVDDLNTMAAEDTQPLEDFSWRFVN